MVILVLIRRAGWGNMTLATLLTVLVAPAAGVRGRLLAQAETKTLG